MVLLLFICSWGDEAAGRTSIAARSRDPAAIRRAPVRAETAAHRQEMVRVFCKWAEQDSSMTVEEIARHDQPLLSELVRGAGWWCFEQNWSLLSFKNLLLGLQEVFPWARQAIGPGWRVASRWEQLEPSTPHAPVPLQVLTASLVIAALWDWPHVLLSLFLGFYALLRPSDIVGLHRSDLSLPDEHDNPQLGLMIRLRQPKRHVGGARVQYTRVDPEYLTPLISRLIRQMGRSERVWPASGQLLGRRWRMILSRLIPVPMSFSLGSLRAGGATFLFGELNEDLTRLAWRGRWRQINTLAHYVQELVASRISQAWTPAIRRRIARIASHWIAVAEIYNCEAV